MGATGCGRLGSRLSTHWNCGVFTPGVLTIVTCTPLPSFFSSVSTDSVKPLMACLAPQ